MNAQEERKSEKISISLFKQYPDGNPTLIEVNANTFKYQLEKNDNYLYFEVEYKFDSSGNLKVSWKDAEQFML